MNILINRNDNLGDIVYTLQLAGLLKAKMPNCKVTFIVRNYALPLLELASDVDATISFESLTQMTQTERSELLQPYDVFINAKACKLTAQYAKAAKINIRIGNSHRWYHWLYCNKRVAIKRKGSQLHEIELNSQLLAPLLGTLSYSAKALFDFIKLEKTIDPEMQSVLHPNKCNVICHPASNGNGREWPPQHFINLIQQADPAHFRFILTGSPNEKSLTDNIEQHCQQADLINLAGRSTLKQLSALMAHADILISAGTGPLHIAAALGTQTIGLFPPVHAIDSKRWGPLQDGAINIELKIRCEQRCENTACACMTKILPTQLLDKLNIKTNKP